MNTGQVAINGVAWECAEVVAYGSYAELVEFSRAMIPVDPDAMKEAARLAGYNVSLLYSFRKGRIYPKAETLERILLGLMPGCVLAIVRLPEDVEYERPTPRPVDDGNVATGALGTGGANAGMNGITGVGGVTTVVTWRQIPGHAFEAGYNAAGQLVPGKVRPIAIRDEALAAE